MTQEFWAYQDLPQSQRDKQALLCVCHCGLVLSCTEQHRVTMAVARFPPDPSQLLEKLSCETD